MINLHYDINNQTKNLQIRKNNREIIDLIESLSNKNSINSEKP